MIFALVKLFKLHIFFAFVHDLVSYTSHEQQTNIHPSLIHQKDVLA